MRILHLVTHRSSFFDRRIESLRKRGHTCDIVTVPGRDLDDRAQRKATTRSFQHYLRFYRHVLSAVRDSYDIVHAHYGLTSPFALAQPHRPVVLTLWGTDLFGEFGWLTERCTRLVDETIVMSHEMATHLDGVATVIPHGVDLDLFKPMDQQTAQQAVDWDPTAAHVLFPYTPSREVKNYPLAERVVKQARPRIDRNVRLHAVYQVELPDVPVYMNAADALLLTSRREGSPNTVKEALACNLPVVATDVGDVRERLDGVTPSAVCTDETSLTAALARVLDHDERSNGRPVARLLSVDRMADQLETVYRQALAG
ncbi:glycosyltransferase family 4 protein [Haloarcula nitratireducens]|uniref:Glycosyltransferase family 4 protein n=1 Tax=Haloarcula nitratireducens TaxID=2487749 RepID=A0AAW4PGK1_9EURY|nr:glycosyltransferase family 4 protein [Halomicroarcula nitratireducens]MBX0297023.1 glycosyltransferase family 4 protein [Halomicroarcula nitratireducens]